MSARAREMAVTLLLGLATLAISKHTALTAGLECSPYYLYELDVAGNALSLVLPAWPGCCNRNTPAAPATWMAAHGGAMHAHTGAVQPFMLRMAPASRSLGGIGKQEASDDLYNLYKKAPVTCHMSQVQSTQNPGPHLASGTSRFSPTSSTSMDACVCGAAARVGRGLEWRLRRSAWLRTSTCRLATQAGCVSCITASRLHGPSFLDISLRVACGGYRRMQVQRTVVPPASPVLASSSAAHLRGGLSSSASRAPPGGGPSSAAPSQLAGASWAWFPIDFLAGIWWSGSGGGGPHAGVDRAAVCAAAAASLASAARLGAAALVARAGLGRALLFLLLAPTAQAVPPGKRPQPPADDDDVPASGEARRKRPKGGWPFYSVFIPDVGYGAFQGWDLASSYTNKVSGALSKGWLTLAEAAAAAVLRVPGAILPGLNQFISFGDAPTEQHPTMASATAGAHGGSAAAASSSASPPEQAPAPVFTALDIAAAAQAAAASILGGAGASSSASAAPTRPRRRFTDGPAATAPAAPGAGLTMEQRFPGGAPPWLADAQRLDTRTCSPSPVGLEVAPEEPEAATSALGDAAAAPAGTASPPAAAAAEPAPAGNPFLDAILAEAAVHHLSPSLGPAGGPAGTSPPSGGASGACAYVGHPAFHPSQFQGVVTGRIRTRGDSGSAAGSSAQRGSARRKRSPHTHPLPFLP